MGTSDFQVRRGSMTSLHRRAQNAIPMWPSLVTLLIFGLLAVLLWRESLTRQS